MNLSLFVPTFLAILFQPLTFFREYHELVTTRETSFWDLNTERDGDPYMGPVKFSVLAIMINNLIFPLFMSLGAQVGAVSPYDAAFAEWAKEQGYLNPHGFTGIGIIDDFLYQALVLLIFYVLGYSITFISKGKIPARFAAGYFFYWTAWNLFRMLIGFSFILISMFIPLFETRLPTLIDTLIYFVSLFMFLGFPILFWNRIIEISWQRVTVALLGGLALWIAALAVLSPLIVNMPDFG
jgi:hypothetical protein